MGYLKFKKSPTAKYQLGYSPGDVTDSIKPDLEKQLIENNYAQVISKAEFDAIVAEKKAGIAAKAPKK